MSISYTSTGRTRQKSRTEAALLDAARTILARGAAPTVEEAAEAAGVARATAYRYFKNRRELLAAAFPELEETSLLGAAPPAGVRDRLDAVIAALGRMIVQSEPAYRAMLRLSLEEDGRPDELVLRRGRAIGWIEEALEPIRPELRPRDFRRLVLAIRSATGIEALVWLTDIGNLSRSEALRVMRWSAQSMLRAATSE